MTERQDISGEYGQLVEHPFIRGLFYMALGKTRTTTHSGRTFLHVNAVVIGDFRPAEGGSSSPGKQAGLVVEIAAEGWLVSDD